MNNLLKSGHSDISQYEKMNSKRKEILSKEYYNRKKRKTTITTNNNITTGTTSSNNINNNNNNNNNSSIGDENSKDVNEDIGVIRKRYRQKVKDTCEMHFDSKIIDLPFSADSINTQQKGFYDYTKNMKLKANHMNKPLWICSDGYIYLEMFNSCSKQASDFLITIAEPICRPELIHEFQLTIFSLYAAISIGITLDELLINLDKFSKNDLPEELISNIKKGAESFGKVKLVLRENKYYIEANNKSELDYILKNKLIRSARIFSNDSTEQNKKNSSSFNLVSYTGLKGNEGIEKTSSETKNFMRDKNEKTNTAPQEPNENCYVTYEAPVLDADQLAFKISENEKKLMLQEQKCQGELRSMFQESKENKENDSNSGKRDVFNNVKNIEKAGHLGEVYSFEVNSEKIEEVKQEALETMQRPLLMEYDFRRDKKNPNLVCCLKSHVQIRYYQEKALRKMFSNGRSRSGIIVLPCGAGKTLTGITAASTIKKSALLLTTSAVAVEQWKKQFEDFTNIQQKNLRILTSDYKLDLWPINEAGVLISTYTMLSYSGKRSEQSLKIVNDIRRREWGLLVFDEVQFAPAPSFRKINDIVKAHCKLGLTATLVREDLLIRDLQWIIGPKLYEANWVELQNKGYLAKAVCKEIWCSMSSSFYKYYLKSNSFIKRRLYTCNPKKLMMCEYLIKYHEQNNDKIIVFSDNIFALLHIAKTLNKPFIYGKLSPIERIAILNKFKNDPNINTILLSKVGDNAIDIPIANVVIQISFNFASRRQEAQRLGRIIRPKNKNKNNDKKSITEPESFFYSLVSKDTVEMCYSDKRQQFLINQGYAYNVVHSDNVIDFNKVNLVYKNKKIQENLLKCILASTDDGTMDDDDDDLFENQNFLNDPSVGLGIGTNNYSNSSMAAVSNSSANFMNSKKDDSLKTNINNDGLLKLSATMDITFNDKKKKKKTPTKPSDKQSMFRKFLSQTK